MFPSEKLTKSNKVTPGNQQMGFVRREGPIERYPALKFRRRLEKDRKSGLFDSREEHLGARDLDATLTAIVYC